MRRSIRCRMGAGVLLALAVSACAGTRSEPATTGVPPPVAGELLVGNKSGDSVWRISLADGRKLGEFASGHQPHEIGVAADAARVLVSNYADDPRGNSLSLFDTSSGEVRTVQLGKGVRPHGLAPIPGSSDWLVTAEGLSQLLRVDVADGRIVRRMPVGEGIAHMVATDGRAAFVTHLRSGTLTRVDLSSGQRTHTVETGAGAEGVAVRPGADEVWVGNRAADTVTVHASDDLRLLATLPSPGFAIRVAFTADGRHALVTNAHAARLAVFHATSRRQVADVPLAREGVAYRETLLGQAALPIGVIADPSRPRVYVAISGGDEIAVVDSERWQVVDRWQTGREPDALGLLPPR
ncbi:MAG: cytochrome D1 domain-containing protein [Pseudoxanthomonas suwonensis]|nr:cytochrome D1 domain-containing protein [Pseudoxanthomonas suwonensis]